MGQQYAQLGVLGGRQWVCATGGPNTLIELPRRTRRRSPTKTIHQLTTTKREGPHFHFSSHIARFTVKWAETGGTRG